MNINSEPRGHIKYHYITCLTYHTIHTTAWWTKWYQTAYSFSVGYGLSVAAMAFALLASFAFEGGGGSQRNAQRPKWKGYMYYRTDSRGFTVGNVYLLGSQSLLQALTLGTRWQTFGKYSISHATFDMSPLARQRPKSPAQVPYWSERTCPHGSSQ